MLDYSFPQKNELHTFVSVVKRSPLFCAPNMGSMTAGILSFAENRILDDFQSLGVVRSFLSCFLFFSCLILFALFVLLGALKFLVIHNKLCIVQWSCRQLVWSMERFWLANLTSGLWFCRALSWTKSSLLLKGEILNFSFLPALQSRHFLLLTPSCWNLCSADLALYRSRKLCFLGLFYC